MNLVHSITIEIEKNDKVFRFVMPNNCPIGEAYDAAHAVLHEIATMSVKAAEQAAPKGDEAIEIIANQ